MFRVKYGWSSECPMGSEGADRKETSLEDSGGYGTRGNHQPHRFYVSILISSDPPCKDGNGRFTLETCI